MTATEIKPGPSAAVLVIGNEILSGRTQDTNTSWIAQKLGEKGINLRESRVVPDEKDKIIAALDALRTAYDYVLTTGGIGPTHDDITADSVAEALGYELEENRQAVEILHQHYGPDNVTPARLRMARMPKGAELIANPVSGAPGFAIENIYVMAGVPQIMQGMLENVLEMLTPGRPIYARTYNCDIQESELAEDLNDLQAKYIYVQIGSYPNFRRGVKGVAVVLRSLEESALEDAANDLLDILRQKGQEPTAITM